MIEVRLVETGVKFKELGDEMESACLLEFSDIGDEIEVSLELSFVIKPS